MKSQGDSSFPTVSAIKLSYDFNTDFEYPHAKLKSATRVNRFLQLGNTDVNFCMFIVSRLIPSDFMPHIVEAKAENYKKLFIVEFHQNLNKRSSLEMLRFFFRSVY